MKILLATDHAGFEMKEHIKKHLEQQDFSVEDLGAHNYDPSDDYPGYMKELARRIAQSSETLGIAFGGSGQGEAIVANRHSGIRAIVYAAPNKEILKLGREHNNANILSIGARFITNKEAQEAVDQFIKHPFPGGDRHIRRIKQIDSDL